MIGAATAGRRRGVVGVDVGGTFTDAALVVDGRLYTAKVPTRPDDQSAGVADAVARVLDAAGIGPGELARFAHGMTVGTNALLEDRLAPAAMVATEGFGDILELRRQDRAHLYRLGVHHPPPVIPHERVAEVRERCGPQGVVVPLDAGSLAAAVARVGAMDVRAVAVCLLFSFAHPEHERAVGAALRTALPGVHVSCSSDVLPEIREYERASTTAVDAALTPVLRGYLRRLGARAARAGLPEPEIMQSSGGLIDLGGAADHASRTVLSGPAGGAMGAAGIAAAAGIPLALTFDMGGTSCDVALVRDGTPGRTGGTVINGRPLHLPMLDVETVSAGGGSIAWADSGGALRVGPRSAGARPGPAAYGYGGTEPTVTDANVVLGRLAGAGELGGAIRLDAARAAAAVAALAERLGLTPAGCAEGIVRVANQEMARALRLVSVERGIDPRGGTVIAFGGAGPMHACEVADEVGAARVLAPAAAGMLAALGLVTAGERRDRTRTVLAPLADAARLRAPLDALVAAAAAELPGATVSVAADCRYAGQRHALTVDWPGGGDDPALLAGAFHDAHRTRYGDAAPDHPVEVVTLRVAAERPGSPPPPPGPPAGERVRGPAAVAMDGATCWVPAGWTAMRDADGTLDVRRDGSEDAWTP
ncbi:MAG: hydantoinase/oxoprolinase family protein [Thermoleophilia bacterium]|nr:hydantoinase/oxoprolinase family protein [Thermoleophilia bacterium]